MKNFAFLWICLSAPQAGKRRRNTKKVIRSFLDHGLVPTRNQDKPDPITVSCALFGAMYDLWIPSEPSWAPYQKNSLILSRVLVTSRYQAIPRHGRGAQGTRSCRVLHSLFHVTSLARLVSLQCRDRYLNLNTSRVSPGPQRQNMFIHPWIVPVKSGSDKWGGLNIVQPEPVIKLSLTVSQPNRVSPRSTMSAS